MKHETHVINQVLASQANYFWFGTNNVTSVIWAVENMKFCSYLSLFEILVVIAKRK